MIRFFLQVIDITQKYFTNANKLTVKDRTLFSYFNSYLLFCSSHIFCSDKQLYGDKQFARRFI